jgi:hypothetical protein
VFEIPAQQKVNLMHGSNGDVQGVFSSLCWLMFWVISRVAMSAACGVKLNNGIPLTALMRRSAAVASPSLHSRMTTSETNKLHSSRRSHHLRVKSRREDPTKDALSLAVR